MGTVLPYPLAFSCLYLVANRVVSLSILAHERKEFSDGKAVLHEEQTEFQSILVFRSAEYGKDVVPRICAAGVAMTNTR